MAIWKYIIFAASSLFGVWIIHNYIFNVALKGMLKPTFENIILNTLTMDATTKLEVVANIDKIYFFIGILIYAIYVIILLYILIMSIKRESEEVLY